MPIEAKYIGKKLEEACVSGQRYAPRGVAEGGHRFIPVCAEDEFQSAQWFCQPHLVLITEEKTEKE